MGKIYLVLKPMIVGSNVSFNLTMIDYYQVQMTRKLKYGIYNKIY